MSTRPRYSVHRSALPVAATHLARSGVTPLYVSRPIDLSFDGPTMGDLPSGWFKSLGYVMDVSMTYEIKVVPGPGTGSGACQ